MVFPVQSLQEIDKKVAPLAEAEKGLRDTIDVLSKSKEKLNRDIKDVENTITELNQKIRQYMMILKTGNSFSMAGNAVTLSYIS